MFEILEVSGDNLFNTLDILILLFNVLFWGSFIKFVFIPVIKKNNK